jgi:hypothetical protein
MNTEEKVRQMMDRARGEEEMTGAEWEGFSARARRSLRMQRMLAAGVGLLLIAGAVVGALTVFDEDNKGLVTPVGPRHESPPPLDCNSTDGDASTDDEVKPGAAPCPFDPDEMPPPPMRPVESWMVDEESETLTMSWTRAPVGEGRELESVIEHLLNGVGGPDAEAGAITTIPEGTELLSASVNKDGIAFIDLSSEFRQPADDKTNELRTAQLVFTATQVADVEAVHIFAEGDPEKDPPPAPLGRDYFDDVAPPIVVESPKIGQEISGPTFEVSGTANVFEGTVHFDLDIPAPIGVSMTSFTTATCGSGCRGDFTETIKFDPQIDLDEPTEATLTVYEESAEDGSRINEVTLPLTLVPWE